MSTKIYIVGTGIVGYSQISKEVENTIERSDIVLSLNHQDTALDYVSELADTVDLTAEYNENEERKATYKRVANRVLEEAEKPENERITFATYGHPMYFVDPARIIIHDAPEDIEVEVLPGISAIDCLYTDIGLDPAKNGLQIFEATDVLVREFELNPAVPAFLLQIGSIETSLYSTETSKPERFTRIKNHLLNFYSEDHRIYLLKTSVYPFSDSEQFAFRIDEFDNEQVSNQIDNTHTLYIPPLEQKSVQNEGLLQQLTSTEHLNEITK